MLRRFFAVGVPVGLCAALLLVGGSSVAEAKAPKRLPLGRLDGMSGTWSITVTDCTACVVSSQRNGQVDVSKGSVTLRQTAFDVVNSLNESVNTPGRPLPASGALWIGVMADFAPRCDGPDFQQTSGPTPTQLTIPFTRAGDQAEFSWILPVCDDGSHGMSGVGIDGFPAHEMPARASVPLSTLKQSRYNIRFVGTVPFDIPDSDPSNTSGDNWRGTLSYDVTLKFSHRCIPRRNGARDCF
jgi:hypothetical protein